MMVIFGQPSFLLDANVFIQAYQQYYPFDICPGFWGCLVALSEQGRLTSIDRVKMELQDHEDELKRWANGAPQLFASSGEALVVEAYHEVVQWVDANSQFKTRAKQGFAQKADGWLVAYAKVHNMTVATNEKQKPGAQARVPILNVCDRFGVLYIDTFEMLRRLDVQFEWRGP